jgi:DNA-binding NtrC family response regulator
VASGAFRKDLLYRINAVEARAGTARRRGDVIDLVVHFFERRGMPKPQIPDPTLQILLTYPWPGNVRELENEIERVVALHGAPDALAPDMFSDRITTGAVNANLDVCVLCESPLAAAVTHLEENLLKRTLAQTNWNKSQSARRLGLSRQGLIKKIKRYGIVRSPDAGAGERTT